jgi:hypothetical protein
MRTDILECLREIPMAESSVIAEIVAAMHRQCDRFIAESPTGRWVRTVDDRFAIVCHDDRAAIIRPPVAAFLHDGLPPPGRRGLRAIWILPVDFDLSMIGRTSGHDLIRLIEANGARIYGDGIEECVLPGPWWVCVARLAEDLGRALDANRETRGSTPANVARGACARAASEQERARVQRQFYGNRFVDRDGVTGAIDAYRHLVAEKEKQFRLL